MVTLSQNTTVLSRSFTMFPRVTWSIAKGFAPQFIPVSWDANTTQGRSITPHMCSPLTCLEDVASNFSSTSPGPFFQAISPKGQVEVRGYL